MWSSVLPLKQKILTNIMNHFFPPTMASPQNSNFFVDLPCLKYGLYCAAHNLLVFLDSSALEHNPKWNLHKMGTQWFWGVCSEYLCWTTPMWASHSMNYPFFARLLSWQHVLCSASRGFIKVVAKQANDAGLKDELMNFKGKSSATVM